MPKKACMLCEKLKKNLGYLSDSNMDILTRTLITKYSNRFEAARYADDCQGEVENIVGEFADCTTGAIRRERRRVLWLLFMKNYRHRIPIFSLI